MNTMGPLFFIFLLFLRVRTQEVSTVSSLLKPRNFNHHSFNAEQFLTDFKSVEPTKQGPVLFPNDAPPPAAPPLVVTSRPLLESIARSERDNNTVTSQSQDTPAFAPFLTRVKDYRPFIPSPTFNYQFIPGPSQVPYAGIVKKTRYNTLERDNRYNDYEERTILPPIFKALSEHAKHKVLRIQDKQNVYQTHQPNVVDHQNNDINEENSESDQNQNYAFSYTVKDHNTGDDFSHSQHSSGSATNGEYRVRLPDGRMQIVSYTADENGYKADVRYDENKNNHIDNYIPKHNINAVKFIPNNIYNENNKIDNTPKFYRDPVKFIPNNIYNDGKLFIAEHKDNSDYSNVKDYVQNDYANIDYNNYKARNYVTPIYVKPTQVYFDNNDYISTERSVNYDVTEKNDRIEKDYYYPENSKEYYSDYSSEYNSNTAPHKSKFNFENVQIASTVKPSYDELKDLFVSKSLYNTQQNYDVTSPVNNEITTERIVLIGNKTPNLYTDIKHNLPYLIPTYATPKVIVATTPKSYLVSTIASLKNKVHLAAKPILSESFINRINKYINLK